MQLGRLPLCQLSYSRPRREVYQAFYDDLAKEGTTPSTIHRYSYNIGRFENWLKETVIP